MRRGTRGRLLGLVLGLCTALCLQLGLAGTAWPFASHALASATAMESAAPEPMPGGQAGDPVVMAQSGVPGPAPPTLPFVPPPRDGKLYAAAQAGVLNSSTAPATLSGWYWYWYGYGWVRISGDTHEWHIPSPGELTRYRVDVAIAGWVKMALTNVPADYDLRLLSADLEWLYWSDRRGRADEVLFCWLEPGTYYLDVYGKGPEDFSESQSYRLSVTTPQLEPRVLAVFLDGQPLAGATICIDPPTVWPSHIFETDSAGSVSFYAAAGDYAVAVTHPHWSGVALLLFQDGVVFGNSTQLSWQSSGLSTVTLTPTDAAGSVLSPPLWLNLSIDSSPVALSCDVRSLATNVQTAGLSGYALAAGWSETGGFWYYFRSDQTVTFADAGTLSLGGGLAAQLEMSPSYYVAPGSYVRVGLVPQTPPGDRLDAVWRWDGSDWQPVPQHVVMRNGERILADTLLGWGQVFRVPDEVPGGPCEVTVSWDTGPYGGVISATQSAFVDDVPPVVSDLVVSPRTLAPRDTLEVTAVADDEPSGIAWVWARFASVFRSIYQSVYDAIYVTLQQEGDLDRWAGRCTVPDNALPGAYRLAWASANDRAGNRTLYTQEDFPEATFTIVLPEVGVSPTSLRLGVPATVQVSVSLAGQPLPNARVEVEGAGQMTCGSDGRATFNFIPQTAGFLEVRAWTPSGWGPVTARISVGDGSVFRDLNLEAAVRETLGIATGPISDEQLAQLTRLEAKSLGITDLTGLERAVNLTSLYLTDNAISDLTPLAGLSRLQVLELGYNQVSDISPLSGLKSVQSLELYSNRVSDIRPLAGLTNLLYLHLGGNQITDVSPLSGLANLHSLYLMYNRVTDISPLASLTNLGALNVGGNQISDVTPLSGLTNLQWLTLGQNERITDISPLSGLVNLRWLDLWQNRISDIFPLAGLTNLEHLLLQYNQVADISPLAGLVNLHEVDLSNNRIRDIAPLVANSDRGGLGAGDRVDLRNNYLDLSEGSAALACIGALVARGVEVQYEPQLPQGLEGDLDRDGRVTVSDLAILVQSYRVRAGEPGWSSIYDLVPDGVVDIRDLVRLGRLLRD